MSLKDQLNESMKTAMKARDTLRLSAVRMVLSMVKNREIDLSKFRSRLCRKGDLWSSDLILTMSSQHAADIVKMMPSVKARTITLDVDDPLGMGLNTYEKTLLDIESKMKHSMNKILRMDKH